MSLRRGLDGFLLRHAPPWYRTPLAQTVALGLVFLCVFTAYTTIQFYAASTYGQRLAADSVGAVYLSFTIACVAAPAVTNRLGCRRAMLCGILGYAALVLCSLLYFLHGGEEEGGDDGGDDGGGEGEGEDVGRSVWGSLVVAGGAVLGCGAALLWTAQGRLILDYAAVAEDLDEARDQSGKRRGNDEESKGEGKSKAKEDGSGGGGSSGRTGTLLGVFWAVFQCSALIGGAISFLYYDQKPSGSASLYIIFLAFIVIGALSTQFLLPPSMLRQDVRAASVRAETGSADCKVPIAVAASETTALLKDTAKPTQIDSENGTSAGVFDEVSNESLLDEARNTLGIFFTREMMSLSVLFFYTGYNQPYQQATFGNRFFTRRTIGLQLIIFHLMEITGGWYCGRALDRNEQVAKVQLAEEGSPNESDHMPVHETRTRRVSAIRCLVLFVLINTVGNVLALLQELDVSGGTPSALDISDAGSLRPSAAFALWGFADAQIQVFCYWLMGALYSGGEDHSRAVGFYKCVQSLGVSVGFYLTPTARLSALAQLGISSGVFALGTGLALLQLPK